MSSCLSFQLSNLSLMVWSSFVMVLDLSCVHFTIMLSPVGGSCCHKCTATTLVEKGLPFVIAHVKTWVRVACRGLL